MRARKYDDDIVYYNIMRRQEGSVMEAQFIKHGGVAYMVIRLSETDEIDNLAVGMLRNNQIPGLLPMAKRYEGGGNALYYTISSLTPLPQSYATLGSEKRLIRFLKDYCMVIKNCEDYLLEPSKLLLDERYVFVKTQSGELSIPYIAVTNVSINADANTFFTSFVHQVVPHLPPDSRILPVLYEQNFRGTFDPDALIKALSALDGESRQRSQPKNPVLPVHSIPQQVKTPPRVISVTPVPIPASGQSNPTPPLSSKNEDKPKKKGGGLFGIFRKSEKSGEKANKKNNALSSGQGVIP